MSLSPSQASSHFFLSSQGAIIKTVTQVDSSASFNDSSPHPLVTGGLSFPLSLPVIHNIVVWFTMFTILVYQLVCAHLCLYKYNTQSTDKADGNVII